MKRKKIKLETLRLGDIFSIPIDAANDTLGFGQIVSFPRTKDVFIICVYSYTQPQKADIRIDLIVDSEILFLGYTTDARLFHGIWNIIGNETSNVASILLPYNKLGLAPDAVYLTNYKGEIIAKLSEKDSHLLDYQTTISPIRFENALKAYNNLLGWDESYDRLLYSKTMASHVICKRIIDGLEDTLLA